MFEQARVKLTLWYLLIIMLISLAFSVIIYVGSTRELHRIEKVQRMREQRVAEGYDLPTPFGFEPEVLEESRNRIRLALVVFNLIILGVSGVAGYFLAGKTLKPIEEMVDEQNKFISGASHELRTPLTALKTSTEVGLRGKNLTLADAKGLLRDNLDEIENLRILTDKLLRLSQFEKVNGDISAGVISVGEILDEARRKLGTLSKSKNISIVIPKTRYKVYGDRASLVEMMVIIFDNAIKYSPKGSKLSVETESLDSKVAIKVADNGIGISQKDLEHIFDRFYRGDKARSKATVSGYGLGLSIAKKIIELYGGSISAESKEGKGSTFTVVLPRIS